MSYIPYASQDLNQRPGAVTTFYVYCALMTLIYLLVAGLGAVFILMAAQIAADDPDTTQREVRLTGTFFLILGLSLAVVFLAMPFLPQKKWAWIVGIIAISLGLTSCCFWPLCIPLLIYYVQEPTRRWYGMEPPVPPMMYAQPGPMPYATMPPPQPPQDPRWGGPA